MTVQVLSSLIDKQDASEVVRDRIGELLILNFAEQAQLATAAGEDPNLFAARVFLERANPFEEWLNDPAPGEARRPIVNIMYDSSSYDEAGSNTVERQKATHTYNIDCYGYAVSADVDGGGHLPGDLLATLAVQRCMRLVRNILMAGENTYLQLRGTVWKRWPQSISMFQPALDGRTVQQVIACRMAFDVTCNEYAPQVDGPALELIGYKVFRAGTGELLIDGQVEPGTPGAYVSDSGEVYTDSTDDALTAGA